MKITLLPRLWRHDTEAHVRAIARADHTRLLYCVFPLKCVYSGKRIWLRNAVEVKTLIKASVGNTRFTYHYYDPEEYTRLKLMA